MAKRKSTLPARQETKALVKARPAGIVKADERAELAVAQPEDGFEVEQEAPSSLTPIITFEAAGDWIVGEYVGSRVGIGPNDSMLHDLKVDGGYFCSIWGSTILDTKFQMLNPKPGQFVRVQFMGLIPSTKNQNPAKNFRLAIVKPKA